MDRKKLNSFSKWIFKTENNTAIAETPEMYLQLIKKIAKEARLVTISERGSRAPKFNLSQCRYLADKLGVAVERGYPILQSELKKEVPSKILKMTKLLYGLAKKVESFVNECCKDAWIQAAMLLINMFEHVSSIGLSLQACTIFFSHEMNSGKCEDTMLEFVKRNEIEVVEKIGSIDKDVLLKKVEAHLQLSTSSGDDGYLAAHLLGLLGRNPVRESFGLKSYELKDMFHLNQLERVGKGSAATVYKAKLLGVEVAKKTFCQSNFDEFEKEVSILAGLFHPNITPLLCYAKGKRECSIVMELMDEDLYSLIQRRLEHHVSGEFPFNVWEAIDIIFQVARGMRYLHEKKIVHRDLKSLNILVKYLKKTKLAELESEYVLAKVSDFGLSKTKETSTRYSNHTLNIGTTRWMAPEVMISNAGGMPNYPFKADVYSFAMVCYEILTGREPFEEMTPHAIKKRILAGESPEMHLKLPNWCPQNLKILISKCWRLDAKERPCFDEICDVLEIGAWENVAGAALNLNGARWFSFDDIKRMTNNFNNHNLLKQDGFSKVYKGVMAGTGVTVAVKRTREDSKQGAQEFKNEIELLSRVHHINYLVGLVGFCSEKTEQILVNEYMPNGTLSEWIRGETARPPLDWNRRLLLALGAARGLAYLHDNAEMSIIHRDVNSRNIQLDKNLNAKVAGFGFSLLVPDQLDASRKPVIRETMGYLAPEYLTTGVVTTKSDVFSFGVVLLELLTGKPPINLGIFVVPDVRTKFDRAGMNGVMEIVDPALADIIQEELQTFLQIALACVNYTRMERPSMQEVVKQLESLVGPRAQMMLGNQMSIESKMSRRDRRAPVEMMASRVSDDFEPAREQFVGATGSY